MTARAVPLYALAVFGPKRRGPANTGKEVFYPLDILNAKRPMNRLDTFVMERF